MFVYSGSPLQLYLNFYLYLPYLFTLKAKLISQGQKLFFSAFGIYSQ